MNPVDHPHGGGEGKSGQGNPHPVSPWGLPTKGYKTQTEQEDGQVHYRSPQVRSAQCLDRSVKAPLSTIIC